MARACRNHKREILLTLLYNLPKIPGNFGCDVNEIRSFGSFAGKFPGRTEILKSYVFAVGTFRMKILVAFTSFACFVLVSGLLALSVEPVKRYPWVQELKCRFIGYLQKDQKSWLFS